MTNKELIKKIIEKAVNNWWLLKDGERLNYIEITDDYTVLIHLIRDKDKAKRTAKYNSAADIIFSHSFAKAFFKGSHWEWRLQQMVLEKNPLEYYEKYL